MTEWRAARALAAFEFKRDWLGMTLTAVFALYVGMIMSTAIEATLGSESPSRYMSCMTDWLYTFALPAFGCAMNRTVLGFWREDIFTRRLSHWRTMPIPIGGMASARMLLAVVTISAAGTIFFASQYMLTHELRETVGIGAWIAAAVTWLCYGLALNSFYLYLEMGFSGKVYVKTYLCVCLGLGLLAALVAWERISLFRELLDAAKAAPLLMPLAAVLIAAAVLAVMRRVLIKRMESRSFTF
ncbi:hypothetical protein [Cohnella sp. 56]|uniref:hypothetical protein n=1 Tax=Cohnella sp. 56 TaxID=3113722 RepID=UPI0030E81A02